MMLRPLLTLALVGTLLATPALAQDTRTTVRAELTALFSQAKVPFIVGPDIDGELTLSVGSVPLAQKVRLIISTLPHKVEYKVENGIHIVRRLPGKLPASASYVMPRRSTGPGWRASTGRFSS